MFVRELTGFSELNIEIISFQYPFEAKKYTWNGITVHALGGRNKKGLAKIKTWTNANRTLKTLNQQKKTDIILSIWATECALIGSRFAKKHNIKHICWIIGQDSKVENKYIKYIKNTTFVCKTPFIKSFFEKNHGFSPSHIISSGLNLNVLPKVSVKNKTIDLIGVGSLITLKRYDWMIDLVSDLKQKGFELNCILIGEGPERINLENRIGEKGIASNLKLLGNKTHAEVLDYMMQSKILIHPSSFEGLSTVTLEALYAGCHVISYCRPFEEENKQMHYIANYYELLQKTQGLISQKDLRHESQLNYTTKRSAEAFVKLFMIK